MAEARGPRSPVALFLFNRPDTTRRVFEAIARARPERLLVVADGPRADRVGEHALCREARAVVERVDWPCQVQTLFSTTNLGCKRRIASGLDWVFSQTDRAILLEDDCLPATDFFAFCDALLERYRDDARVHMIRGSNFLQRRPGADSYYFSQFFNIWGWASWSRAWSHYDLEMRRWPELRDSGWLERILPHPRMAPLVRRFFDETHAGRVDTWDYQWMMSGWLAGALAAVPAVNLVSNLGHGVGATHTGNQGSHLAHLPLGTLAPPFTHPASVAASAGADQAEWNQVYPRYRVANGWWNGLRRRGGGTP